MNRFYGLLVTMWCVVVAYTAIVIENHGMNLFPVFFGDMVKMGWPGQFNLDFMCMLILSGLWVSWRHHFSTAGLALGVVALFGGTPFLATYLLIVGIQTKGDLRVMLLGKARAILK